MGAVKDICTRTVTMMAKVCLDVSTTVSSFVALNLARLPPVVANHVDMNAVLVGLSALRR